jgi:hypothetical protein
LKNSHALLVSCLDGRLIIQSFRTHEYQYEEMLMLWKNYIYQALKTYFEENGKLAPTPQRTAEYQPGHADFADRPGPEYLFDHACAGFFTLRFRSSPQFQQDLFEHHAQGTYLVLHIRMQNTADFPIMVWDKDYFVEGSLGEGSVLYSQNSAATGYLPDRVGPCQGVIEPEAVGCFLAFDIDPGAT